MSTLVLLSIEEGFEPTLLAYPPKGFIFRIPPLFQQIVGESDRFDLGVDFLAGMELECS